ncbi:MAG: hypothetical protein NVS9B6_12850 [Candidatus Limnocylindrales bacterium]
MPVGKRDERGDAEHSRYAARDQDRSAAEAIGREAGGQDEQRGDDVPAADDDADIGGRSPELGQVQSKDRRDQPEADAPQQLRASEGPAIAG